jgi:hypothetical protein
MWTWFATLRDANDNPLCPINSLYSTRPGPALRDSFDAPLDDYLVSARVNTPSVEEASLIEPIPYISAAATAMTPSHLS